MITDLIFGGFVIGGFLILILGLYKLCTIHAGATPQK